MNKLYCTFCFADAFIMWDGSLSCVDEECEAYVEEGSVNAEEGVQEMF